MADRISLAKAITRPPNRHRKPWDLWLASWLWIDIPTWTMPQPRIIMPMALIAEKMKSDRLLTTVIGSVPVAKAVVVRNAAQSVRTIHTDRKCFARLVVGLYIQIPPFRL